MERGDGCGREVGLWGNVTKHVECFRSLLLCPVLVKRLGHVFYVSKLFHVVLSVLSRKVIWS